MTQRWNAPPAAVPSLNNRLEHSMHEKHYGIGFCMALVAAMLTVGTVTVSAGEITGTVKFKGKPRTARPLKIVGDEVCAAMHKTPPPDEKFVYAESDEKGIVTLANVFVWVKKGLPDKEYDIPKDPVTIDQKGCTFVPHVLGVRAGQNIEIKNSDKTAHNVHAIPKKNKQFNNGQPPATRPLVKSFARDEVMVRIKCDIHKWMGCYVGVVSHPFYAVTCKDGTFSLKDLPDGEYEIEIWHELLKTQSKTVKVRAAEATNVEFIYAKP